MSKSTPVVLGPKATAQDIVNFLEQKYELVECHTNTGLSCILQCVETEVHAVLFINQDTLTWHIMCTMEKGMLVHLLKLRLDNPASSAVFLAFGSHHQRYSSTTDPEEAIRFVGHNWLDASSYTQKGYFKDLTIDQLIEKLPIYTHIVGLNRMTSKVEFVIIRTTEEVGEVVTVASVYYEDVDIALYQCYSMSTCGFTSVVQWSVRPTDYAVDGIRFIDDTLYELKAYPYVVEHMRYREAMNTADVMAYLGWQWEEDINM